MSSSLIFIAGTVLVIIALGVSAIGVFRPDFPARPRLVGLLLGGTALVLVVTCVGAVLASREEQKTRREKIVKEREAEGQPAKGARVPAGATTPVEQTKP